MTPFSSGGRPKKVSGKTDEDPSFEMNRVLADHSGACLS